MSQQALCISAGNVCCLVSRRRCVARALVGVALATMLITTRSLDGYTGASAAFFPQRGPESGRDQREGMLNATPKAERLREERSQAGLESRKRGWASGWVASTRRATVPRWRKKYRYLALGGQACSRCTADSLLTFPRRR
jgi:hypothetical protein